MHLFHKIKMDIGQSLSEQYLPSEAVTVQNGPYH